jgi:Rrf2 family transcriptional regulator, nitric oxide-sensitive transcriptional repressor
MRLTTFTDYCLRVLIYAGIEPDRRVTIDEIAERYGISRNHLMKVVYRLGQLGYLDTVRGKGGGFHLRVDPADVNVGRLVRETEEDLQIVECFGEGSLCAIEPACVLRGVLGEALGAFLDVLDQTTLADLIRPHRELARLLSLPPSPQAID